MLDAAALAAILDPERKVPGWWKKDQPNFGPPQPLDTLPWTFKGQPNLHTAREHAWRLEEWLEKKSYGTVRALGITQVFKACGCPENDVLVEENTDHTAALVAAVERIANEVR